MERRLIDTGYSLRECDARQAAFIERSLTDPGYTVRDLDAFQAEASFERISTDTGDSIFNYHFFKIKLTKWAAAIIPHRPPSANGQSPFLVKRPGEIISARPTFHYTICGIFSDGLLFPG